MPQQLTDIIRKTRSLLNEPSTPTSGFGSPRFYTDTEITDWVNDACRDIARRAEDIQHISTSLAVMVGTAAYALPADVIRIHRVEFIPTASAQLYPIAIVNRQEVDQLIGFNPTIQSSYPFFCWLWGTPGNATYPLTLSFYPVFGTGGTINLWYFRMPVRIGDPVATPANYNVVIEIPEGWDDAVVMYATYKALMKARNPEWQQRKGEYEQTITQLIEVSRNWHDQVSQIVPSYRRWSMDALFGGMEDW